MEVTDILQFYAFSADKSPGKGTGDSISDPKLYEELNEIKNWRRMFSSFWSEDPFMFNFDNKTLTYQSYEHVYQAAKFKINGYDELAYKFCVESNDPISKMVGPQVQKAGRLIKLTKEEVGKWDDNMNDIKTKIYRAKFTLDSRPGKALIATKNAQLINAGPRIKKIHCTRLESLRAELSLQITTRI